MLISGKQIYYDSESDARRAQKMRKWEVITSKDRVEHGRYVLEQLTQKCKDKNVRTLLGCFSPVLTELEFNRVSIVSESLRRVHRLEPNLVLMCNFLDPRGAKCPLPDKVPESRTKLINVLVDMVLARLKNYAPNKCGTCRMWYAVPFGTIPDMICALCSRGRHDCTPVPLRYRSRKCYWFCPDCGVDMKDELYRYHGGYSSDCGEDEKAKRKEPKRHTGFTESISSHVDVISWNGDDSDDSRNDSGPSELLDDTLSDTGPNDFLDIWDRESCSDTSTSDYDIDNYEFFQTVHDQQSQPIKNRGASRKNKRRVSEGLRCGKKRYPERKSPGVTDVGFQGSEGPSRPSILDSSSELYVSEEEIAQAIEMLDCDVGISPNTRETVPGICLIMAKEALVTPLSILTTDTLQSAHVPDAVRKAKVYYVVKNIKALLK